MTRRFIELPAFQKAWKDIGLSDDDLAQFEAMLLKNPQAGTVIQGSGGARKVRFEAQGKGKSGGGRAIYVDIAADEIVFFALRIPKIDKG